MDDTLVGLGDAYEAEARFIRGLKLPEDAKARLEKIYDERAADAYRKVVLEHSASAHVEDARDRLAAMNLPVPTPTPEQAAASAALENSRRQYALKDRAKLLLLRQPDVVMAARDGEPPLADPKPTLAPAVTKQLTQDFNNAMNPGGAPAAPDAAKAATADTPAAPASTPATPASPATPLQLQEIPAAAATRGSTSAVMTNVPGAAGAPPATSGGSNSMGVEIVSPSAKPASNDNGGLKAVGPPNASAVPAIEKPAVAPDQVNDVPAGSQPAAQAAQPGAKKTNPSFDKSEESSSKHKKKKGLSKLNPF
jgi:outer membrane protein assembly factor BamD